MATALYRRYRPEAFSEMIGQAHVTEPLMTALRAGRIGHAYLFSGPRGCGKTTSARILARCLNCAEGPTDTPCGTCPSCVELSREGGGSLDVVEIDAASHGGVDDARELRERAVFAPARDRYKIFIIDEAHMVTSGGFNALLKIVEEPPPHVKFVFATTEPDKVIGTIRSRTHHYPFRLIAPGTLIDYVQQLADSEGIEVEPGVLPLVVRAGGGSVRDTLSILDQLIAGSEDGRVGLDRATGLLGFTSTELLDEVIAAFGAGDAAAAFAATDRVVQTGQDPRRFVEDLLERLRDLIVIGATSVDGASAVLRGVPEDQLQRMFAQAQLFAPGRLSRIADTVSAALDKMTGATAPRLHLELMIARALVERARPEGRSAEQGPAESGPERNRQARDSRGQAARPPSAPRQAAPAAPAAQGQADQAPASQPTERAAQPPAETLAPGGVPEDAPAVDVTATLRSARDFLNSDSAGAGRPGGRSDEAERAAPAPADDAPTVDAAPADAAVEPVGLGELREVWPELLEELLESDREAWNAVKNVQPLALEGEVLTVGLASRSDLDAFKAAGAGPLREAIEAALGVTVTYVPRPLPAGSTAAPREPRSRDAEPSPATEPGGEIGRDETPAPAWADPGAGAPVPDEPSDDRAEEPEYQPAEGPSADRGPAERDFAEHDSAERDSAHDPAEDSEAGEADEGDAPLAQQAAADDAGAAPAEPAGPSLPEPIVGRYGEAVVREMLGARFVEERPLPQGEA